MSVSVDVGVMWRLSEDFNRRFGLRMQPAPTATTHHPHPHPHHAHHAHHHTAVHHYHHQHHHPHGPNAAAAAAAAAAASHSSMIFNGKDDDKANGISGRGETKRNQMRNKNRNVEANSKLRIPLFAFF